MSLLPDYQQAVILDEKLVGYCLNEEHPVGKDKAYLFRTLLGITADDSDWLKQKILSAISIAEAKESKFDQYGRRYVVDFPLSYNGRTCQIRISWIILKHGTGPRLTSCYILQSYTSMTKPKLLDVVALMKELPDEKLVKGQVGTIVELLGESVYEVEFSDQQGRTIAMCALSESDLLVLHYKLEIA